MRTIKEIPAFFSDYIKKNKPVVWPDLDGATRRQLRVHIKTTEQHNVDAYTQQRLNTNAEHIDHFKKRVLFPKLCFDYENLFVANHNATYGASYKDNKIKKEDYKTIYNPALYMHKFKFSFDGSISPLKENDKKVEKTIEVFNLDDKVLKRRRQAIFRNAKNMSSQYKLDEILKLFKFEFHSGIKHLLQY